VSRDDTNNNVYLILVSKGVREMISGSCDLPVREYAEGKPPDR
jgi:hypothetical protein